MSNDSNELEFDDLSNQIELLVEGELVPSQRRAVIDAIEQDPNRWRELAFAFLEHQTIRNSVRTTCRMVNAENPDLAVKQSPGARLLSLRQPTSWWKTASMLAACGLIAFVLGMGTGRQLSNGQLATIPNDTAPTNASDDMELEPSTSVAQNDPKIVGYVQWQSDEGVRLSPVFDGTVDDQWLAEHPPQVNEQMQRLMSRAGWQMEPSRKFVSVNLASGDKFTIPMDDVTYRYIGRKIF